MVDLEPDRRWALILYQELAPWWPLLSAPEDYAEEAGYFATVLRAHSARPPRTLLELGSGGGNNASHLKHVFESLTLVDISPEMLAVSRRLNPECEHLVGDMRRVRLGRRFDCVFVHDAIVYATTPADLASVIETAWVHCEPGGTALFAPDFVRENFRAGTDDGGHDDDSGRGLRYLEWVWDPEPRDTTYRVEYAVLARDADGTVRSRHDSHLEGLFSLEQWTACLEEAGFAPRVLRHQFSDVDYESILLVAVRRE